MIEKRNFASEFKFSASRSSGAGGQNVNKVSSKIELRFNVTESNNLTLNEKALIMSRLANRINSEGELILTEQTDRSQLKNKTKCILKFYALIDKAITPVKKRRTSTPTIASIVRKKESKVRASFIKKLRKKRFNDDY